MHRVHVTLHDSCHNLQEAGLLCSPPLLISSRCKIRAEIVQVPWSSPSMHATNATSFHCSSEQVHAPERPRVLSWLLHLHACAQATRIAYEQELIQIMHQYGVVNEFELVSGLHLQVRPAPAQEGRRQGAHHGRRGRAAQALPEVRGA